jgi:hypothetical protein
MESSDCELKDAYKRYSAGVLQKIHDFVLDNNSKEYSLKICSVLYGPMIIEGTEENRLCFVTRAKNLSSKRGQKLEKDVEKLESEIYDEFGVDLMIMSDSLGDKTKGENIIFKNSGIFKVLSFQ